jgi:hypothetical protein
MATRADVRRIALALPGTEEGKDYFAFSVLNKGKAKGYAWSWRERVDPKKARVANPRVLAVRVANLTQKETLLSVEPVKFFTEPHYNGYPAILVRLEEVTAADLRVLLKEAWRCVAPKELLEPTSPKKRSRR